MSDIAIRVENLSNRYRIGQYVGSGAQYKTLREVYLALLLPRSTGCKQRCE